MKKRKIARVFMIPLLKKILSGELLQLRQSLLKILSRVENLKNRKHKNLTELA